MFFSQVVKSFIPFASNTHRASQLTVAISACLSANFAYSAGLEYSSQPILPLFETGNYAEVSYAYVTPDLKGKDIAGNTVDNMMQDYGFSGAVVKVAPTPDSALALFYHQPWGVKSAYPNGNIFHNELGQTHANVKTNALSIIAGGKITDNFMLYGGVEHQSLSGNVEAATPVGKSTALASIGEITTQTVQAYIDGGAPLTSISDYQTLAAANGSLPDAQQGLLNKINASIADNVTQLANSPTLYTLDFEDSETFVPMIGIAFEKPEIKMKAALTYRTPAKYDITAQESLRVAADPSKNVLGYDGVTKVDFPQSVNFDFQTGLSEKYQLLGMINARWVDWSEFEVAPPLSAVLQDGNPLAKYADDQYTVEVALGKQFTPKFAAEVRLSYDTGTGAPLSALGPYDSVGGVAVGAQYDMTNQITVSGGVQYLMVEGGDVTDSDGETVMSMNDSDGYAFGVKMGYHF